MYEIRGFCHTWARGSTHTFISTAKTLESAETMFYELVNSGDYTSVRITEIGSGPEKPIKEWANHTPVQQFLGDQKA